MFCDHKHSFLHSLITSWRIDRVAVSIYGWARFQPVGENVLRVMFSLFDREFAQPRTDERAIEDCVLAKISENDDKPDDDNDMNVNYQKYF